MMWCNGKECVGADYCGGGRRIGRMVARTTHELDVAELAAVNGLAEVLHLVVGQGDAQLGGKAAGLHARQPAVR